MGYEVEMKVRVKIPKEKKDELLAAFKELDAAIDTYKGLGSHTTVKAAFEDARYDAILSKKGYYYIREFIGQKLWDDERFWKKLAPLIVDGSYIVVTGEDHARWKWKFKDGKMETKHAAYSWD